MVGQPGRRHLRDSFSGIAGVALKICGHTDMSNHKKSSIEVQGTAITVLNQNDQDYLSLTDIARYRNSQEPFAVINNWMRDRSTVEFLGLWEKLSNPDFKPLEFERFKNEAGRRLNAIAIRQMQTLTAPGGRTLLSEAKREK